MNPECRVRLRRDYKVRSRGCVFHEVSLSVFEHHSLRSGQSRAEVASPLSRMFF